jgi:hypothetical protein
VFRPAREHVADLQDPELAEWAFQRLRAHPWKTLSQPLTMSCEADVDRIPRTIVNCTPTVAMHPPDRAGRQEGAARIWEIDTPHDLMLTAPEELAEMLARLA